jgi:hypothetical protein
MRTLAGQRGASPITWAALLAVIALVVVTVFKLIPLYLNDYTVSKVLEDLGKDPEMAQLSAVQLWNKIDERLNINSVYNVQREHYKFEKKDGRKTVSINYEARKHLLGNVDLVATFSRTAILQPTKPGNE